MTRVPTCTLIRGNLELFSRLSNKQPCHLILQSTALIKPFYQLMTNVLKHREDQLFAGFQNPRHSVMLDVRWSYVCGVKPESCPRKGISAIMEKRGVKVQFLAILGVKMQISPFVLATRAEF
jgi:hypothetical protein